MRLIIGEAFGRRSPVREFAATPYLEVLLPAGGRFTAPANLPELAAYIVSGAVRCDGRKLRAGVMAVACPGAALAVVADKDSRIMLLGGASVGPRIVWWNFVAATRERIDRASADWQAGRFAGIAGDDEFIPLPGN